MIKNQTVSLYLILKKIPKLIGLEKTGTSGINIDNFLD